MLESIDSAIPPIRQRHVLLGFALAELAIATVSARDLPGDGWAVCRREIRLCGPQVVVALPAGVASSLVWMVDALCGRVN